MRIALLGDIALFGCFSINKNKDLSSNLKEIGKYLEGFDLVVGNLESPFSTQKKTYGAKSAYVCSDVENIGVLKWLNVNIVNLANNHMFDYGKEGYETTKKLLSEAGIQFFGTEGKTIDVDLNDNHLRFSGYCCYSTNPLMISEEQGGYGVNKYNVADVKDLMKTADDQGYLNIIAAHVGLEHVNYPSLDHVRAARQLADDCPYVYYGHHPHVVQGVEEYKGSLIAHSLGNFCFDDVYTSASKDEPLVRLSDQNRTGMILELTIENNLIKDWKEQLIHIGNDGCISLINSYDDLIKPYNEGLKACESNPEYEVARKGVINARLSERRSKRNIVWVLKRLRPRYIKLILDMRRNSKLYVANVTKYIG